MYLKCISDFIKFVGDQNHTLEEILAHLVLRTMAPMQASSAVISYLDNQNSLVTIGRFGIPPDVCDKYEDRFSLFDHLPMTDALRLRKNVVVNSLPYWPDEYTLLSDFPYPTQDSALISFPIERCGTPFAVASIFFQSKIFLNNERVLFVEAISRILSLYLSSPAYTHDGLHGEYAKPSSAEIISIHSQRGRPLSKRQFTILRMMSEGQTNLTISQVLKFSESTIRQESIKIFSKLGCKGRIEASQIYRTQELQRLLITSQSSEFERKLNLLPMA